MHDLDAIEAACWQQMIEGTGSHRHPFHQLAVANNGEAYINLRMVVLRNADPLAKSIAFHTDIRSGKWAEIAREPGLSAVLYDAQGKTQIRLGGNAALHRDNPVALRAWEHTTENGRKLYRQRIAPSAPIPAPGEIGEPMNAGYENFGVVQLNVSWMEWLWLSSAGHRRARFTYEAGQLVTACWLAP